MSNENPAKNLSIQETLDMVENAEPNYESMSSAKKIKYLEDALDKVTTERDQYRSDYYQTIQEFKEFKSQIAGIDMNMATILSAAESELETPTDNSHVST